MRTLCNVILVGLIMLTALASIGAGTYLLAAGWHAYQDANVVAGAPAVAPSENGSTERADRARAERNELLQRHRREIETLDVRSPGAAERLQRLSAKQDRELEQMERATSAESFAGALGDLAVGVGDAALRAQIRRRGEEALVSYGAAGLALLAFGALLGAVGGLAIQLAEVQRLLAKRASR